MRGRDLTGDLMGRIGFTDYFHLLLTGSEPTAEQRFFLDLLLVSIAEHGMVPDVSDPLRNTRTTLASWWERIVIAPNRVNFHLEHHLMMTVPHHNLPRGTRIHVGTSGTLEEILYGPARTDDGTQNLVGALRTCMGTVGAKNIKEMQLTELIIAPAHAYLFVKKWETAQKARWLEQARDELTELTEHLKQVQ